MSPDKRTHRRVSYLRLALRADLVSKHNVCFASREPYVLIGATLPWQSPGVFNHQGRPGPAPFSFGARERQAPISRRGRSR